MSPLWLPLGGRDVQSSPNTQTNPNAARPYRDVRYANGNEED